MTQPFPFQGPSYPDTRTSRDRVVHRLRQSSTALAERIHTQNVRAWGLADEGPFPTREEAEQQAREELHTLIHGLGPWAGVDPGVLDDHAKRQTAYRWPSRELRALWRLFEE